VNYRPNSSESEGIDSIALGGGPHMGFHGDAVRNIDAPRKKVLDGVNDADKAEHVHARIRFAFNRAMMSCLFIK